MTQPVSELSNFSRITLALKCAAQAFQPPIAFSLPVLCLFGDELFHQWLKLRQPLAFATVNRSKSNRDQSRYLRSGGSERLRVACAEVFADVIQPQPRPGGRP